MMFTESYEGLYDNRIRKVKWFAGVADGIIHVTLSTPDKRHLFYDHMIGVKGKVAFERELVKVCEYYIEHVLPKSLPKSIPEPFYPTTEDTSVTP